MYQRINKTFAKIITIFIIVGNTFYGVPLDALISLVNEQIAESNLIDSLFAILPGDGNREFFAIPTTVPYALAAATTTTMEELFYAGQGSGLTAISGYSFSWEAPTGITGLTVEARGGGGGGGGSSNTANRGGGGGGGGGYARSTPSVTAGNSYSLVLGIGGRGGTDTGNGVAGTATTFAATTVVAAGGGGGAVGGTNTAGAGGTANTGTTTFNGGNGSAGVNASRSGSGGGGAGDANNGSAGGVVTGGAGGSAGGGTGGAGRSDGSNANGLSGIEFGGGGSGGYHETASTNGGRGGGGAIAFSYTYDADDTYPIIRGISGDRSGPIDATSHVISLPPDIEAGELLLVVFSTDANESVSASAGWTVLSNVSQSTNVTGAIIYKVAAGGDTLTLTTTAEQSAHIAYRIANYSGVPTASSTTSTGADIDPTSHSPAGGSDDYLWIAALAGADLNDTQAAPSGYSFWRQVDPATGSGGRVDSAVKFATGASEDPGAWDNVATNRVAFTIAIAGPRAPTVTTGTASSVSTSSVSLAGEITATGGQSVTTRGIVYATDPGMTSGLATSSESGTFGTSTFSRSISSLSPNTTYYYRAFATNPLGTGIGATSTFTTLPNAPGTPTLSDVSTTTIDVSWTAPSGGAASYELQRCIGGSCTEYMTIATTTNLFYDDTGLMLNTSYSYQVLARNAVGATSSLSSVVSTTTLTTTAPSVTTSAATSITSTSATIPGNITSMGVAHGIGDWTTHTAAGDNDQWLAVTYGNGLFVAIGNSGDRVMTSPDGVTWTAQSAAGNNDAWAGVTYGNGTFVAVGGATDRVMTSPDGITWTAQSAAGNNDTWTGVTYGNGLFVAVGNSGDRVMTSPDGVTWTIQSAAGNNDAWAGVTYGAGLFVAVSAGATDRVMTSPDGVTWTIRSAAGNNDTWNAVTYGGGLFVAVGSSGDRVMTSPDGITWTAQSAAGNNDSWWGVTYGNGLFVALGGIVGTNDRVITSPDGINWTIKSAAGDNESWAGIYGNGTFVAVSAAVGTDRAMTAPIVTAPQGLDHGFLWGTGATLVGGDTATSSLSTFSATGAFDDQLTDLQSNTTYYFRAYATSDIGTTYGTILNFTTLAGEATVITDPASSVTASQATIHGEITDDGGVSATARGFAISTSSDLSSGVSTTTESGTFNEGTFSTTTLSLASKTTYYYRAFATTGGGTTVGDILSFTTEGSMDMETSPATAIGDTSATFNGDILETGLLWGDPETGGWTARSAAGDNDNWSGVTYANGLFVAVAVSSMGANDDNVMTSPDGITWTVTSTAGSYNDIIYAEGLFVAVGDCPTCTSGTSSVIRTSPDGTTWTERHSGDTDTLWNSVTYGGGLFVAVGADGDRVVTSPDGITWTVRSAAGDDDGWQGVTYAEGLFVAVGASGDRVMTSSNGITWATSTAAGNNDSWTSVTYGNGLFVAVGSLGDRVMTSPDGVTWTTQSASSNNDTWADVTYGGGLFVAVGSATDRVMTSPDGVTWTAESAAGDNDDWLGVTYANGTFVAVGRSSGVDRVMTAVPTQSQVDTITDHGFIWGTGATLVGGDTATTSLGTLSSADAFSTTTNGLSTSTTYYYRAYATDSEGTEYGDIVSFRTTGPTVVVTNAATSIGGTAATLNGNLAATGLIFDQPEVGTWTARNAVGDDDTWSEVAYGNGLFVAVAGNGDDWIMTSPDGVTWTSRSSSGNGGSWVSLTYGNGLFVGLRVNGFNIVTSPDGVNWTYRSVAGDNDSWKSITYGEGIFVAVGSNSDRVMTSPDGVTWTVRSAAGDDDSWQSVTYGNGLFVAVGGLISDDRVMTSPDGITWTARSAAGDDDRWNSVTYGGGLFVAVGSSGDDRVMTSPDGVTWTERSAAGDNDSLQAITYADGLFVAVGGSTADRSITSPDGINWTVQSIAGDNDSWVSVAYGGGLLVAVSSGGTDRVVTADLTAGTTTAPTITDHGFLYGTGATLIGGDTATSSLGALGGVGSFNATTTGLTGNTTYYFRAYATHAASTTLGSILSFTTLPAASGEPEYSDIGTTTVTVSWDAPAGGATSYNLSRCHSGGCALFNVSSNSTTTAGLSPNTTYSHAVQAVNAGGNSAWSATTSVVTLPLAPGTPQFSNVSTSTLTVSWTAPSGGAATYRLERCAGGACSDFAQIATGITDLFYADSNLSASTTYRYRALAVNATGASTYSAINSTSTTALPILSPEVTTLSATEVDEDSGRIHGDITSTGNMVGAGTEHGFLWGTRSDLVGGDTATSSLGTYAAIGEFDDLLSSLSFNTTYYFRTYAKTSAGTTYGSIVSFRTVFRAGGGGEIGGGAPAGQGTQGGGGGDGGGEIGGGDDPPDPPEEGGGGGGGGEI
jgi:hypothetical protein